MMIPPTPTATTTMVEKFRVLVLVCIFFDRAHSVRADAEGRGYAALVCFCSGLCPEAQRS
jgi:hypothetical protein